MQFIQIFVRLSSLALFCLSSLCWAQQEEDVELDERYENWYQIELIVFERLYGAGAASPEIWPKNISLQYPLNTENLISIEEWEAYQQALTEREALLAAMEEEAANQPSLSPAIFVNPEPNSQPEVVIEERPEEIEIPFPEMETPRLALSEDERELNNVAYALNRRNTFRVLFHEAWRQELKNKDPQTILIRGGEKFGDHSELEGYIELSINRYLHLRPNLWRTRFELNYGQQQTEYWPELPTAPRLVLEVPPIEEANDSEEETHDSELGESNAFGENEATQLADSSDVEEEAIKPEEQTSVISFNTDISFDPLNTRSSSGFQLGSNSTNPTDINSELSAIEKSPYLVKSITTLRQQRRMRSEEVHYIDHPELGIIVKLIPYEVALPPTVEPEDTDETVLSLRDSSSQ